MPIGEIKNPKFITSKTGDISGGNYTEIEPDGTVLFRGNATTWDDMRASPTTLPELGANAPTLKVIANDGSATIGSAFRFDGSSSYGTVGYYADMDVSSMSIAVWLRLDDTSQEEIIDRDMSGGFEFYVNNGRLYFSPDGAGSANTDNNTIVSGATQLAVVTVNSEGANVRVKLYIDGNLKKESVLNSQLATGTDGVIIGKYHNGGWFLDGVMDDIQMYNVVLTQEQITEMYNTGEGITGLPTGIIESTDLIMRFQDSLTNTATLGSGYDLVGTDITIVDGLVGVITGSFGVVALSFPPGQTSSIFFPDQLPHKYKEGTDIYLHLHWNRRDLGVGNVVWGVEYIWVNIDDQVTNTTITEITMPVNDVGYHKVNTIAVLDGTGKTISSILSCRVYRKGDDAADTFTGEVFMSELDFHYMIDSTGSREEYVK